MRALQRARVAGWLRVPTPPTLFGLAMRHDGIDALVIERGSGPGRWNAHDWSRSAALDG
jgi:hypothetical protein